MRRPPQKGKLRPAEARKHLGENGVDRYVGLLAGRQVLHTDGARLDVTVTRDQGDRGTRAVGGRRRAAARPAPPASAWPSPPSARRKRRRAWFHRPSCPPPSAPAASDRRRG